MEAPSIEEDPSIKEDYSAKKTPSAKIFPLNSDDAVVLAGAFLEEGEDLRSLLGLLSPHLGVTRVVLQESANSWPLFSAARVAGIDVRLLASGAFKKAAAAHGVVLDLAPRASVADRSKGLSSTISASVDTLRDGLSQAASAISVLDPTRDGIDFVNVYSGGRTFLGRALSNFTPPETGVLDLPDGVFASVEGYWFWLLTRGSTGIEIDREDLRKLSGLAARKFGGDMVSAATEILGTSGFFESRPPEAEFRARIRDALYAKVLASPNLADSLASSSLPFVHFYEMGGRVIPGHGRWLLDVWEEIRRILKGG
jgi:hypothetical protein